MFDSAADAQSAYSGLTANIDSSGWNVSVSLKDNGQAVVMDGPEADVADALYSDWAS